MKTIVDYTQEVKDYVDSSVQNLSTVVSKNGAKNLIPLSVKTQIKNGVTITVQDDGSIVLNGTPTADIYLVLTKNGIPFESGKCILSGVSSGGSLSTYALFTSTSGGATLYQVIDGQSTAIRSTNGDSAIFDINKMTTSFGSSYVDPSEININLKIANGYTCDNVLIEPMIRLASDTNPTYEPYAMTNRELTQAITYSRGYLPIVDLGTSYTQELKDDISSGTFKKAVVGGKLTINGHVYYLAHPDYWLKTGDTECTTHHMLVVPAGNLASDKMNNDNSTAGGYAGSGLKSGTNHDDTANTALADVAAIIKADFGAANILTHREYFTNAVANGKPSAGAWYDSDIDLMNENMVYGTNIFLPHPDGSTVPNLYTIDKTQIKLFAERPDLITTRASWWLRDVVSVAAFADVSNHGIASFYDASASLGVRPAFAIC